MYATKLHVYAPTFESKCLPSRFCSGMKGPREATPWQSSLWFLVFDVGNVEVRIPLGHVRIGGRSKATWRSVAENRDHVAHKCRLFVSNSIACGFDAPRVQSAFSQPACRCSQMNEICERRHACGADADWNHHAPSPAAGWVLTNECHL